MWGVCLVALRAETLVVEKDVMSAVSKVAVKAVMWVVLMVDT